MLSFVFESCEIRVTSNSIGRASQGHEKGKDVPRDLRNKLLVPFRDAGTDLLYWDFISSSPRIDRRSKDAVLSWLTGCMHGKVRTRSIMSRAHRERNNVHH